MVPLTHGLPADGERCREAWLRPLDGRDEEALARTDGRAAAARASALLDRVVERVGALEGVSSAALTVGDRERLLWQARRLASGDRLDLVLDCPACTGKLDVSLDLSAFDGPVPGGVGDRSAHPGGVPTEQREEIDGHVVGFRLPTGADQEAVADSAADPPAAARALLARCVLDVDGAVPDDAVLARVGGALAERMAALDPQAETRVDTACPACGAAVSTFVDAGAVLIEELTRSARWLLEEVHALAWHYHWSEADILALTAARRGRYLELIDVAVSAGGR